MAQEQSPSWRRAFDAVERRVGPRIATVTSSADLQVATAAVSKATREVTRPVHAIVAWGLHLAGLPSYTDVRALKSQLARVEREVTALRRDLLSAERDEREQP